MNDHDPENLRAADRKNENVTSNDLDAKRFASSIRPTPAVHLAHARPRTRLRKTFT